MKLKHKHLVVALGLLFTTSFGIAQADSLLDKENVLLAKSVSQSKLQCAPGLACSQEALVKAFYKNNKNKIVWTDKKARLNDLGEELVGIIRHAYEDGLNPKSYHLAKINELMNSIKHADDEDDEDAAKVKYATALDLTLTDALFAYSYDMYYGKISQTKSYPYWTNIKEKINLVKVVESGVAKENLADAVDSLRPTYPGYAKLRAKLSQYQKVVASDTALPIIPAGSALKNGSSGDRVELLQERLAISGELDTDYNNGTYDDEVEKAVLLYQYNNGLYEDGIVTGDTLKALNFSLKSRISQIQLNLDKMRLLPEKLPKEYWIVNLPEFSLNVYNGDKVVTKMDVAVGGKSHPSCVLNSKINNVVIHPYWNIPPSIASEEIFPILKKDPNYIVRKNMEVLQKSGSEYVKVNEPEKTIDWANMTEAQFHSYRYRQIPGEGNALGKVKFLFPNTCGIYLHDSNETEVFDVYRRDFSHGCIRVAEPKKLTELALDKQKGWDSSKVDTYWKGKSSNVGVNLSKPIDLYIMYFTAWVNADSYVQFRRDVYGLDKLSNYTVYIPTEDDFKTSKMKSDS